MCEVGFGEHHGVKVTISLAGDDAPELASLYTWLQRDDEFRGMVHPVKAAPQSGEMGGITQALIVTLGSGGTITVLAGTLSAWLSARRTRISVDFSVGDRSQRVDIDAANAADAERLFKAALDDAGRGRS